MSDRKEPCPGGAAVAGLDGLRLEAAFSVLEGQVQAGRLAGAAMAVARAGSVALRRGAGVCRRPGGGASPMPADAVFLVASVTKPLTALAAMLLVERGLICLDDPVESVIPEFRGGGRHEVTLRHLLTHTSGLPDMLPENVDLRRQHAPLSAFVEGACRCALLFRPGTRISYQSMGIAVLGEIVERITAMPLRDFLGREVFAPLGMRSTSLGLAPPLADRVALVDLPAEQEGTDWHWNTPYWQQLGVPWGGMYSTVGDLVILLQAFLDGGCRGGRQVFGRQTALAMVSDQTSSLPHLEEQSRRSGAWGFGWRIGWCDLSSAQSFSHGGATGTLVGADRLRPVCRAPSSPRPRGLGSSRWPTPPTGRSLEAGDGSPLRRAPGNHGRQRLPRPSMLLRPPS